MAILIRNMDGLNVKFVWHPAMYGKLEGYVKSPMYRVIDSATDKPVSLQEAIELDKEFIKEENERKEKQGR